MGDQDNGGFPLARGSDQSLQDELAGQSVQGAGGLVGEHDGRLVDQCPGHRGALGLTPRDLVDSPISDLLDLEPGQNVHGPNFGARP